jgi:hypothetical protein
MPEPYADTVAAGRTALVARLRTIAARLEELPLDAAAEVLVLLEPAVAAFEGQAALALERAPTRANSRPTVKANPPRKMDVKATVAHELSELMILTAYLYVVFCAILFYRYAVLRGVGVGAAPWGLAIIKALLVAKFVQLARAARIGERYQAKPLIWPTLYKSVVFLAVVWILTVIEEAIVGLLHGRSILESVAGIGGGTALQFIAMMVLTFFIFFPYFGIRCLGEVMGEHSLFRLFFVERREFWAVEPGSKHS